MRASRILRYCCMSSEDEIEERMHRVEAIKLALDGFFNERERKVTMGLKEKRE
jgi:hypothetical protein